MLTKVPLNAMFAPLLMLKNYVQQIGHFIGSSIPTSHVTKVASITSGAIFLGSKTDFYFGNWSPPKTKVYCNEVKKTTVPRLSQG